MNVPFPDPIAAAQAVPPIVALGAALVAWPVWHMATRLADAAADRCRNPAAAFAGMMALVTAGFAPVGVLVTFGIGRVAEAVAHLDRPRCTIERFMPNGESAGVLFLDGPCPTDGGAVMGFSEGAERFASVAWWFLAAALALPVVLILGDVAAGLDVARATPDLAAWHARGGGGGHDG